MDYLVTVKKIYPELDIEGNFENYQPIIDTFGTVLVQVNDDDYQGDTRVLYKRGSEYGYLCFGWWSCSGCDALQACSDYKDVAKLMGELDASIIWWQSPATALWYFKTHDWEGDFAGDREAQGKFVRECVEVLEQEQAELRDAPASAPGDSAQSADTPETHCEAGRGQG